jgi:hypothetical protein
MKGMSAEKERALKTKLVMALMDHVGRARAISMARLHERVFGEPPRNGVVNGTRMLRYLIDSVRHDDGKPICSSMDRGGGYYIAGSDSELNTYLKRLETRAIAMLGKMARIRKQSVASLTRQLAIRFEENEQHGKKK